MNQVSIYETRSWCINKTLIFKKYCNGCLTFEFFYKQNNSRKKAWAYTCIQNTFIFGLQFGLRLLISVDIIEGWNKVEKTKVEKFKIKRIEGRNDLSKKQFKVETI